MTTGVEGKDGIEPAIIAGVDGLAKDGFRGVRILTRALKIAAVGALRPYSILPNRSFNWGGTDSPKEVHDNMRTPVIGGWLRTVLFGAIVGALTRDLNLTAVTVLYFAGDTLAMSFRRVGYGRIHSIYPNQKSRNEI